MNLAMTWGNEFYSYSFIFTLSLTSELLKHSNCHIIVDRTYLLNVKITAGAAFPYKKIQ